MTIGEPALFKLAHPIGEKEPDREAGLCAGSPVLIEGEETRR